jgi:hypothetical protein
MQFAARVMRSRCAAAGAGQAQPRTAWLPASSLLLSRRCRARLSHSTTLHDRRASGRWGAGPRRCRACCRRAGKGAAAAAPHQAAAGRERQARLSEAPRQGELLSARVEGSTAPVTAASALPRESARECGVGHGPARHGAHRLHLALRGARAGRGASPTLHASSSGAPSPRRHAPRSPCCIGASCSRPCDRLRVRHRSAPQPRSPSWAGGDASRGAAAAMLPWTWTRLLQPAPRLLHHLSRCSSAGPGTSSQHSDAAARRMRQRHCAEARWSRPGAAAAWRPASCMRGTSPRRGSRRPGALAAPSCCLASFLCREARRGSTAPGSSAAVLPSPRTSQLSSAAAASPARPRGSEASIARRPLPTPTPRRGTLRWADSVRI